VLLAAQRRLAGRLPDPTAALRPRPPGLAQYSICALSGLAATRRCPQVENELLPGPGPACDWHVARPAAGADRAPVRVAWPTRYRAWAAQRGLLDAELSPAGRASGPPLRIANPPAGAVYFLDPTLRSGFQTLPLRAERQGPPAALEWRVDGRLVGRAPSDSALDWPLAPGPHTIEVSDPTGLRAASRIAVR
jgi:membrane carboxypeptidase/penicillin-binding protein PbpC